MENKTIGGPVGNSALLKYAANKKDPSDFAKQQVESPRLDCMDEDSVTNSIPISKFKSNHLSKKEKFVDSDISIPDV
jgi:hypothetical protein